MRYMRKSKRRKERIKKIVILLIVALVAMVAWKASEIYYGKINLSKLENMERPEWIDVQIIDVDGASRSGEKLDSVKDIVIHYVGNPGSTAQQNHDFYAGDQSNVSSHFVVGLDGEVIQCIPLDEMSAASNWRNNDTISIEVCHADKSGKFNKKTYKSLVKLTAWLEMVCGLNEDHVIRHYDITGKECPRYYVKHEDAWKKFKKDVKKYRK